MDRKTVLTQFMNEVWSEGNVEAWDRYLGDSYSIHHDPGDPWHRKQLSRAEFKERVRLSRAPFPDHFPGFPASGKQISDRLSVYQQLQATK